MGSLFHVAWIATGVWVASFVAANILLRALGKRRIEWGGDSIPVQFFTLFRQGVWRELPRTVKALAVVGAISAVVAACCLILFGLSAA